MREIQRLRDLAETEVSDEDDSKGSSKKLAAEWLTTATMVGALVTYVLWVMDMVPGGSLLLLGHGYATDAGVDWAQRRGQLKAQHAVWQLLFITLFWVVHFVDNHRMVRSTQTRKRRSSGGRKHREEDSLEDPLLGSTEAEPTLA